MGFCPCMEERTDLIPHFYVGHTGIQSSDLEGNVTLAKQLTKAFQNIGYKTSTEANFTNLLLNWTNPSSLTKSPKKKNFLTKLPKKKKFVKSESPNRNPVLTSRLPNTNEFLTQESPTTNPFLTSESPTTNPFLTSE